MNEMIGLQGERGHAPYEKLNWDGHSHNAPQNRNIRHSRKAFSQLKVVKTWTPEVQEVMDPWIPVRDAKRKGQTEAQSTEQTEPPEYGTVRAIPTSKTFFSYSEPL
jgi:hypothetical protein